MFAPANTPPEIVDKLQREVKIAVADPGVAAKLAALGVDPVATSPAEFKQFVSAELRKQAEAVRIAGIEPE